MSYSGLGIYLSFTLFFFCASLPIDAKAELETSALGEVTQEISPDSMEIEISDEDELYEDESDEDDTETCPEDTPDKSDLEKPIISYLDATQKSISSRVESLARNIDEFFTKNGDVYDSSGTYLRLRHNAVSSEGGVIDYTTDVRFKLRLPNTQKKLKLFFETNTDKDPDNISTSAENTPTTEVKEGDSVLGLQAESREKYGIKFRPTVGVHLGSVIDTFVKFRFRKEKAYVKWNLKWHETLQWYDSIGWGVDSYFELSKKINGEDLFRSSTFARWTNETDQFELSQVFSMFHVFSKRKALTYYAGAYGVSEPEVHATYYLLGANYRQNIYKDYFFIEIEPQIKYQEINDFHAEHSLTFRLEITFKK
jgi:hypothetical protein